MVRVLPRLPRIGLSPAEIRNLADSFLFLADIVEPDPEPDATLRDRADQPVLGMLRASGAEYLITADKALLALRDSYPVVTPAEFGERYGG
jgi:predicted nucleic acid-binding protein